MQPNLKFSREEYAQRLAKTRKAMDAKGIDLLICSDPSNMAWLTGYDGWSFYVHQAVIVAPDGEPVWFGRGQDANGAKRTAYLAHDNIVGYADHYVQSSERHPMDYLSAVIGERGSPAAITVTSARGHAPCFSARRRRQSARRRRRRWKAWRPALPRPGRATPARTLPTPSSRC